MLQTTKNSRVSSVTVESSLKRRASCLPGEGPAKGDVKRFKVACQKRVKFGDPTLHIIEDLVDDISLRWYQQTEYQEIKNENRETIREMQQSNGCEQCFDMEKYCTRGLEPLICALIFHIPANRQKKVVQAVLCMQQLMRQVKNIDLELLRRASTTISKHDNICARNRATSDAKCNGEIQQL